MSQTASKCVILVLASLAAGCGSEPRGRVFGKVTYQGTPVAEGLIVFSDAERGIHMTADIASDGCYELQTAGGFGLPLGEYAVAVTPPIVEPWMPGMPGEPPPPKTYDNIPPQFRRQQTSGLALTVVEGENRFDINMPPE